MMKNNVPFDLELYRKLLKKYKSRNPDKMMELLENDPLLTDWKFAPEVTQPV